MRAEKTMNEKKIETYFTHLAKSLDIYTVKLAPTEKGLPDRLVLHASAAYFIEFNYDVPLTVAMVAKVLKVNFGDFFSEDFFKNCS